MEYEEAGSEEIGNEVPEQDQSSMKLGGNINLNGFQNVDGGTKTIVMKMIGQFTRDIQTKCQKFEKISVNLSGSYEISIILLDNGKEIIGKSSGKNLLMALGDALRNLQGQFT